MGKGNLTVASCCGLLDTPPPEMTLGARVLRKRLKLKLAGLFLKKIFISI